MVASRRWSYLVASLLALITLFVFYVLQNYGPESAVRRFHSIGLSALDDQDPRYPVQYAMLSRGAKRELGEITTGKSVVESTTFLLQAIVRPLELSRGSYRIARIDYQEPNQVTVAVLYELPVRQLFRDAEGNQSMRELGNQTRVMVWIVNSGDDGQWRINSYQTEKVFHEMG